MSTTRSLLVILLFAGAVLAGASLFSSSGPFVSAQESWSDAADATEQAGDVAEAVIDRLIEQGVLRPSIDYDDPLLASRKIVVSGEINAITARHVVSKLLWLGQQDPSRPIDLYLRTNGGWGNDAFAICDAMQVLPCPVNTWAMGSCESAGASILAAGTGVRRVMPHSLVSLHFVEEEGDERWSWERGSREREEAFWARYAKLPKEFSPFTGDRLRALSPQEAVEYGVADEVVPFRKRPAATSGGK